MLPRIGTYQWHSPGYLDRVKEDSAIACQAAVPTEIASSAAIRAAIGGCVSKS
jgi:hypothetical protein